MPRPAPVSGALSLALSAPASGPGALTSAPASPPGVTGSESLEHAHSPSALKVTNARHFIVSGGLPRASGSRIIPTHDRMDRTPRRPGDRARDALAGAPAARRHAPRRLDH